MRKNKEKQKIKKKQQQQQKKQENGKRTRGTIKLGVLNKSKQINENVVLLSPLKLKHPAVCRATDREKELQDVSLVCCQTATSSV